MAGAPAPPNSDPVVGGLAPKRPPVGGAPPNKQLVLPPVAAAAVDDVLLPNKDVEVVVGFDSSLVAATYDEAPKSPNF